LTVCAVAGRRVAAVTFGDTAALAVTRRRVRALGFPVEFLAPGVDAEEVPVVAATLPRRGLVVVASDGLLDFTPRLERALREVASVSAEEAVERLMAAAFAGGAADNVALAVTTVGR